ncbi:hypothetical protein [Acidihalobacter ferrooxydans]|uniref:Uncharacterized protein n=1 Tax=Acidihalobacter ferrooxydans TaxID=1765967 RepID=A0A1P8UF48_9GAMM|nr:hypothetical protein [Acidihalobacter ferrooxydans]APZ42419.1 hypothetical protein BW247_04385 [Acidihalobacter ferrooxydans]
MMKMCKEMMANMAPANREKCMDMMQQCKAMMNEAKSEAASRPESGRALESRQEGAEGVS